MRKADSIEDVSRTDKVMTLDWVSIGLLVRAEALQATSLHFAGLSAGDCDCDSNRDNDNDAGELASALTLGKSTQEWVE